MLYVCAEEGGRFVKELPGGTFRARGGNIVFLIRAQSAVHRILQNDFKSLNLPGLQNS